MCEHNAGRSQMAAALTHELSNGQVAVRSAGSHPTEKINPVVVEAMSEIGIDVRMEFPKPLTDEVVRAADVVVTLGCGDACPVYPGKRYEDWEVADPAGQPIEVVRRIRYDIHHRVIDLLELLAPEVVDDAIKQRLGARLEPGRRDHRHPRQPAGARGEPRRDRRDRYRRDLLRW